jgi:multicomponent Na+:H+ antiporter subunit C
MSAAIVFALAGGLLVGIGLYAFIVQPHLLRRLIAFNVMGSGVFLLLVGLAQEGRGVDPVPQAMVITGIVVAVASTALALVVFRRWYRASGRTALPEDL